MKNALNYEKSLNVCHASIVFIIFTVYNSALLLDFAGVTRTKKGSFASSFE